MESPAALRQPDFRSLWLAGLVSDAGDWMLLIALPIVVYGLTGSALGTSAAFLAELAPGVVLAPLAGWLADRLDRRRLMLTIALLQALALAPLLLVHGRGQLPIVYARDRRPGVAGGAVRPGQERAAADAAGTGASWSRPTR